MKQGISTNIGSYVGSSQIWTYVHGERPVRPAAAELDQMRELVRQAMEQGALGVASSLSGPPGSWIDTDTLVAMCKAASIRRHLLHAHADGRQRRFRIGGRSDRDRPARERAGRHHPSQDRRAQDVGPNAGADRHHRASARQRAGGAGQRLSRIAPGRTISPASFRRGRTKAATQAMIARLKDPALRPRLENEIHHGIPGSNWYDHYTATGGWEGMLLVSLSNPAVQAVRRQAHERGHSRERKPSRIDVLFELLGEQQRLRSDGLFPPRRRTTCATR